MKRFAPTATAIVTAVLVTSMSASVVAIYKDGNNAHAPKAASYPVTASMWYDNDADAFEASRIETSAYYEGIGAPL